VEYPTETAEYLTYIFENLEDSFDSVTNLEECQRKIQAPDMLIIKFMGIK
jgi:hypothetical protein